MDRPARITLAFVVASALVTLGPDARAQARPASAPSAASITAREWFQRGLTALDQGRFDDAIRAFEQSYQRHASPVVQYNLGLALRGVGRIREAVAALEGYLRRPSEGATPEELATVAREVDRLRDTLGTLELDVLPRATRVVLDAGEVLPTRGTFRVDPGSHTIAASLEGYRTETRVITVARGRSEPLALALEPTDGAAHLQVEPDVAAAVVLIDDREIGRGMTDTALSPGPHTVLVRAQGFRDERRSVTLSQHGSVRLSIAMHREGPVAPWLIGASVGSAIALAGILTGVAIASSNAQPRVYSPSPSASAGWLGNTLEDRLR
jgi:hypothetical protein